MVASINPFNGQTLEVFQLHSPGEVECGMALAWQAFPCDRETPLSAPAAILTRAAHILEAGKRRRAALMTEEMGKTLLSAEVGLRTYPTV